MDDSQPARNPIALLGRRTAALVCAGALLLAGRAARAEAVNALTLQSGHSIVVGVDNLKRVAIGDPTVAGVVPIGTSQLIINAKKPGKTSIILSFAGGQRVYEVTVSEQRTDAIAQMLRGSISEPDVQVVSFDHAIVVRGSVTDASHFAKLTDVLGRFERLFTAEKYSVVNAVTVTHPLGSLQEDLTKVAGGSSVRVDPDAKGNVIVSGQVNNRAAAEYILERVRGLSGPYLSTEGKVIDRLGVDTTTQIAIKVYVLELDRTGLSQLGVRLQSGTPDPERPNKIVLSDPMFPIIEDAGAALKGKALTIGAFARATRLAPTLDLLVRNGNARILSQPDIVTLPGKEATFLVGGQLPIPFSSGLGVVNIVYKDFGVKLQLTPTLLGNGSIDTKIAPEVSDLDFQDGVQISGFTIPAIKTSRLSTEVITAPGESILLGGMLRRIEQRSIDKIPLLGDIPVLGKLFRSTRYQTSDTDIVFVMTPELITR